MTEKTKHLITALMGKAFYQDDHISNTSILNAHLAASDKELEELERLARIGAATVNAFEAGLRIEDDEISLLESVEELLDWNNAEFFSPTDRTCAYCKFYKDSGRENECLFYGYYCYRAYEVKDCKGFEPHIKAGEEADR